MGYVKDFSQAIPINNPRWKNIHIADSKLEDNGKVPAAVKTTVSGDQMQWSPSSSKDVIGYRVYSSEGKKVASIPSSSETLSYTIGGGGYYVVAIDVAGRESKPSNSVENEDEKKRIEEEEKKKKKRKN